MRKSRLSWYKQQRLIELFVAGVTARTAASLIDVNIKTAISYFQRLRVLIYDHSEHLELLDGEDEADESYFGGRRKGKRGRGAGGKVPVFGLLKRNGKVFTVIIPDAKADTLMPIIRQKVKPDSIVYTDTWRSYNALDVSEFKHYRLIIVNSLQTSTIILMVLRTFGIRPSDICVNLMEFQRIIFTSF